jgi:hypothetical protein
MAGTGVTVGTRPWVGTAAAGTAMVGISAGTNTEGAAARLGGGLSPLPNSGTAEAGLGSPAGAVDGGIGGQPGAGVISAGVGAKAPGRGAARWWVRRSA